MLKTPVLAAIIAAFAATMVSAPRAGHAQEAATIRGKVIDSTTGKPVPGASVFDKSTGESAITDDDGSFEFAPGAATGPTNLVVVDPSYKRAEARFDGSHDVAIELEPISVRGEEIVVEAERERATSGETTLKREEIAHVPGARGDALNAIKNLPGVANVQGFGPTAGLVIRGSSPADSRIFVDGFEIPILYHLGGVTSVMPTEMIDDIVYSPGAFGVEVGRASGGSVQVASRRGAKELAGFADVSFIHASTMLQGPLGKRGSFAVAARRSYIDALIPLVVQDSASLSFTALPRYYDYQGRLDYDLSDHLKLTALLFGSDDVFAVSTDGQDPAQPNKFENDTRFTRAVASLTYDRPGVYNKLAVSGLTQRVGLELGDDRFLEITPVSLAIRDEAKLRVAPGVSALVGAEGESRETGVRVKLPRPPKEGDPSQPDLTYDPLIDVDQTATGTNLAVWSAIELQPASWFKSTAGVRVDNFRRNDAVVVQPRVQTRFRVAPSMALLAAGGLYTRPPDNQDENLQTSLAPERAWQTSLGVENKIAKGLTFTTTAYYVDRSDLIVANGSRGTAMSSDGSDTYTNDGVGRSYGAEMLLQARSDRFFGWAAYTYARSERRDDPMGSSRLFDSDQTHNLVLLGSLKLGAARQWQVGGRFQLTSGTPYTPVTGAVFDSDRNEYQPEYGVVNSQRNPAEHQLDLRVDRTFTFESWKLSGYLDVSNVYLNAPVVGYSYNANYTERTETKGLPILPSFGLRGEF
ncbi:MAG TPA: TonB-dependent receptor [Kofleriaceae bacterium]|nr:TonB-dependent receptor [Kofleriaceae bacterium]